MRKFLGAGILAGVLVSAAAQADAISEGKEIAFNRTLGNCLACHKADDGKMPGNVAPPLIGMKARFPDKKVLRDQIWDATVKNPNSMMPPFGKHGILTENQIDKVVEYIHTL